MAHEVTEKDLRAPEFQHGAPEDYEFRADGKIVRKDRFMRGMQDIASILFGPRRDYEVPEVVAAVHRLQSVRMEDLIDGARVAFESNLEALKCLDHLQEAIDKVKDSE